MPSSFTGSKIGNEGIRTWPSDSVQARKDFDRDRAIEASVAGLVNFAHPPGAN